MKTRCLALPLLLLAWTTARLAAQDQPEAGLATIKVKTDLTDEDRNQIRAYVAKRIDAVRGTDEVAAQQATAGLRAGFDGSDAFKRAYASICLDAIGTAARKLDLAPATRLLTVVNTFNTIDELPVLLDALQDDRVGVRAAAAIGLRSLREKVVQSGKDAFQRVLAGLKEAGKKEKSRDTLKAIYAAMNYAEVSGSPDPKANAAAVLELLDERARQYAAGDVRAMGADDAGLRVAQALAGAMDDADRKRLMGVVGTMMKSAIEQYTGGDRKLAAVRDKNASRESIEYRNSVERLILVGEELLAALLKPDKAPNVSESMRKLDTTGMKNQWRDWVNLLQKSVGQDFTLNELPVAETETPETPASDQKAEKGEKPKAEKGQPSGRK